MTDPRGHRPDQRLVDRPTPPEQLGMETLWQPAPHGRPSIDEVFEMFLSEHPDAYRRAVEITRRAKDAGRTRISAKMIVEILRYEHLVSRDGAEPFAINNVISSRLARQVMADHPDLAEMFETRRLHGADA